VKHVLDQKHTRVDITIFTPLQVRKLISYVYAFVTDFSVRRIHNNKMFCFFYFYKRYIP